MMDMTILGYLVGKTTREHINAYSQRLCEIHVAKHPNLDKYKLFYAESKWLRERFGEVLTDLPEISEPGVGATAIICKHRII